MPSLLVWAIFPNQAITLLFILCASLSMFSYLLPVTRIMANCTGNPYFIACFKRKARRYSIIWKYCLNHGASMPIRFAVRCGIAPFILATLLNFPPSGGRVKAGKVIVLNPVPNTQFRCRFYNTVGSKLENLWISCFKKTG